MRLPRLCFFAVYVGPAGLVHAASFDDRVEALFRRPQAEMMAISPDGQRVAYTRQGRRDLTIVIMNVENFGRKRTVLVNPNSDPSVAPDTSPVQLRFLRWATADRLVFAPAERIIPLPPVPTKNGGSVPHPDGPTIVSPIMAVDAEGRQIAKLVDARDFLETPASARKSLADLLRTPQELQATRNESIQWRMPHLDILGFVPNDREQLIIQTRGGYSIPTQHLVDLRTATVREFGSDWPSPPGDPQVFDWFRLKVVGERKDSVHPATVWRDEHLAHVQRELDLKFPRRIVEIIDWSDTRGRVLFRVTGGSDPGRIFVFQRPQDLVLEIFRRTPWLNAANLNPSRFFEFDAPDGARLSGYVTWPKNPRSNSTPLLVVFPSGFPGAAQPAFDPEAQIFADMGFIVARLNHRCVAGIKAEDVPALRAAVDRVSVNDAREAIEHIAVRFPDRAFDRKRVATLGRGYGGYLAVRALQLQPEVFRCGVAIDAPMDLRPWLRPAAAAAASAPPRDIPATLFEHDRMDWKKISVLAQAEALTKPVFILAEPNRSPAVDVSITQLRAKLQGLGRPPRAP